MNTKDHKSVLEVSECLPPPSTTEPFVSEARSDAGPWAVKVTCGLSVLLIHALMLVSLHSATATTQKAVVRASHSVEDSALEVFFIEKPMRVDEVSPDGIEPVLIPPVSMPLALEAPPILDTQRLMIDEVPASRGGASDAELVQANEIYRRQINARILRAWHKPRTPVDDHSTSLAFACRIQLEQDADGNVKEVLLPKCNGTREWQRSLLSAIRSVSPLPAPPDPRVFSASLVLEFEAHAYTLDMPADEYQ